MRQTIGRDVVAFPITDGGIVNDRVEAAERVDLGCDLSGAGDRFQVACYDSFGLRQCAFGVIGPGSVTSVEDDLMTLMGEQFACRRPRPVDEPEIKMRDMCFSLGLASGSVSASAS